MSNLTKSHQLPDDHQNMQICVACNRLQSFSETSCECGHVLREALTLREENSSRKRRAPYRPNSISSEWISAKERAEIRMALKKARQNEIAQLAQHDKNNNSQPTTHNAVQTGTQQSNKQNGRTKKHAHRKKLKSTNNPNIGNQGHATQDKNADSALTQENQGKQNKLKELLEMIENSYQNIYFNRCKSYKKAKLSDLEFEFDFSMFDSHDPFYPTALQDINTKINKTNRFWNSIS